MEITKVSSAANFSGSPDVIAQNIALNNALNKAKKRQRNHQLAYLSVPLVAGIATAALTKGNSKILGKEVSARAAKLSEGLKSTGSWGLMLGAISAIGLGLNAVSNKSEGVRNFRINHPVLSFVGDAALIIGSVMAIPFAGNKLFSKLSPRIQANIASKVGEYADKFNKLKAPAFLNNLIAGVKKHTPDIIKNGKKSIVENTPDGIKDFGKTLVSLSPHLLFFGTFLSSLAIPARMKADYIKEYKKLSDV